MSRNAFISLAGLVSICILLTSCIDEKAMMKRLVPADDDTLARQFIESIRLGNYDKAKAEIDATLQGAGIDEGLHKVHDLFAKGDLLEIEVVGCNINVNGEKHLSDLSYQLRFPHSWAFGDVVIDTQNGSRTVVGFHFREIPESLETLNRFSLRGKSVLHYVVFACCVVIPIFVLYALVLCIRTKIRRKWLWIIFIIFGLMEFNFNWTTGAWDIKPLSIELFASGYRAAGPYAPYIFNFGFPVGAIVFLAYRSRLRVPPIRDKNS